ncbi:acidic leucine-rich nuclear phosphoprotein 32 family member A isoform X4 [Anopheles funestus]|uniref:acidic leucine-rich nuclear phosphoprotein 32 family member A isoform X4 n=1 Tax=Anopheles funestus TaxID=62324 RepID=UPI0020C5F4E6|nr:acidic leucine-rich nuclear phosphoprotein 32 family member A isoform X4 [Anopheles funestus]
MEKRILLEKRGRSDDEITELILDNCRSTYIDGLTDSFTALETLSLINVGLVSLKNFPKLSNLRKLELSDNRISNGLSHLMGSPKLTHLNLSGNRIKDFDELQPLKDLENLEVLDLFNNQVTLIENYREKLFQLIPSLNYLDGFDKEYVEAPSDEEDMAEEEADDSCEESDDVSLAYLYNDNLEEDQEDWKSVESDYNNADEEFDSEDEEEEEGADNDGAEDGGDSDGEGEDDDGEEEEDGADDEGDNEEAAASSAAKASDTKASATVTEGAKSSSTSEEAAASAGDEGEAVTKASEPEARGTKRKFQGTDSDG